MPALYQNTLLCFLNGRPCDEPVASNFAFSCNLSRRIHAGCNVRRPCLRHWNGTSAQPPTWSGDPLFRRVSWLAYILHRSHRISYIAETLAFTYGPAHHCDCVRNLTPGIWDPRGRFWGRPSLPWDADGMHSWRSRSSLFAFQKRSLSLSLIKRAPPDRRCQVSPGFCPLFKSQI
jgi:hypothetical protein